eukprot:scaffold8272_cov22-Cyclotella_meneghiniana.AAC.1
MMWYLCRFGRGRGSDGKIWRRQAPVAKSPHFAPAHVGAARQASGIWYDWQALASQSSHSLGDCLTT